MKKVLLSIVIIALILGIYCIYLQGQLTKTTTEKEVAAIQLESITIDLESVKNELDILREELNSTNKELEAANKKIENQSKEIEDYKAEIESEEIKWQKRYEKYPIATEAWIAMKAQGWSDIVCAGIMGNLMAETGGSGTLHLDWDSNGKNGYGLIQWIGGRRTAIKNKYGEFPTVKEQIQFVHDELFGTDGVRKQVSKSQLNAIMNAETPEDCAFAFASYYERCATQYRDMRRGFARKAYNYFVD